MRKLILLILSLAIISAQPAFAAATKADRSRFGSNATPNITDASNGNTADVSANGDLIVRPRGKSIFFSNGLTTVCTLCSPTGNGTSGNSLGEVGLGTGPQTVFTISFTGDAIGDTLVVYDGTSATGAPKFEIETAVARTTIVVPLAGASFSTEVYLKFYNAGASALDSVTITYDTDTIS